MGLRPWCLERERKEWEGCLQRKYVWGLIPLPWAQLSGRSPRRCGEGILFAGQEDAGPKPRNASHATGIVIHERSLGVLYPERHDKSLPIGKGKPGIFPVA